MIQSLHGYYLWDFLPLELSIINMFEAGWYMYASQKSIHELPRVLVERESSVLSTSLHSWAPKWFNTSFGTQSHYWLCMAFFCFIYLNTINTIKRVSNRWASSLTIIFTLLLLHTSLLTFPSKLITWILYLSFPCNWKAGSSACHLYRTAAAEVTSRVPVYSQISNCPTFRISMLLHRACKWQCQFSPQQQVRLYLTCTLFSAEEL